MDLYATVAGPVEAVFGYLVDPSRLNDWLPQVVARPGSPEGAHGIRITCSAQDSGTQIHVRQPDDVPLTIDLARLARNIQAQPRKERPC